MQALKYTKARSQVALGRRYFRLFKWYPCWLKILSLVSTQFHPSTHLSSSSTPSPSPPHPLLFLPELLKWTFLGLYFFLEALTITNGIGLTEFEWGPRVLVESNKCWFYALAASIVVSALGLWFTVGVSEGKTHPGREGKGGQRRNEGEGMVIEEKTPVEKVEKTVVGEKMVEVPGENMDGGVGAAGAETSVREREKGKLGNRRTGDQMDRMKMWTQIAIDAADLFIPGQALGWFDVSLTVVGTASTISTVLAGRQIWERVQRD